MNNEIQTIQDVRRPDTLLSADRLKMVAMIIMLIDHIGAFLLNDSDPLYPVLRIIGRLAFPIFCYLIAEGTHYTRSMPKYMGRMAVFAIISTPPYNLVHGSQWYSADNINVFFTLFFGLAAIYSVSCLPQAVFRKLGLKRLADNKTVCLLLGLPLCALCFFAAHWMETDYAEYGVAVILIFWLLRRHPAVAWLSFAALTFFAFCVFIASTDMYGAVQYYRINVSNLVTELLMKDGSRLYYYSQKQIYAVLAIFPCMLYNGKRSNPGDKLIPKSKYLFYAFYPVHLWCLWLIQLCAGIQ